MSVLLTQTPSLKNLCKHYNNNIEGHMGSHDPVLSFAPFIHLITGIWTKYFCIVIIAPLILPHHLGSPALIGCSLTVDFGGWLAVIDGISKSVQCVIICRVKLHHTTLETVIKWPYKYTHRYVHTNYIHVHCAHIYTLVMCITNYFHIAYHHFSYS